MKLTKDTKYDLATLHCTGWTESDGTGHDGYNFTDYFRDGGVYLGPDEHGIEPLFDLACPDCGPDAGTYRATIDHVLGYGAGPTITRCADCGLDLLTE